MAARDWFRALQVPVLPVSAGPVVAGSLFGAATNGRHLDPLVMGLVLLSVLLIQVGANLQKGLVESRDLGSAPSRPRSSFVFDAGAVLRTGLSEAALSRAAMASFAAGAGLGLAVVAIREDLMLLVLGMGGFVAAYSYSGPPFKLSYRGVGEVSTFLAFGPLMFIGAFYAQNPEFFPNTVLIGSLFGFLAAAISFARYFPPAREDEQKGKRTPVVKMGASQARVVFAELLGGAVFLMAFVAFLFPTHAAGAPVDPNLIAAIVMAAVGAVAAMQLSSRESRRVEAGVRTTVLLHFGFSAYLAVLAYFALLGAAI